MKYRTKSADALNEADRFQRILDWQLFTFEQDQLLWGYNESVEWKPGDPLYPEPWTIVRDSYSGCLCESCLANNQEEELSGYYGHHVRPMIQTYEYLNTNETLVAQGYYERATSYERMRCRDCDVSWFEGDDCWVCGKSYPRPKAKVPDFKRVYYNSPRQGQSVGSIFDIEEYDGGLRAYIIFELENEMGRRWREFMNEQLQYLSIGFQQTADRSRQLMSSFGSHIHGVLVDEAAGWTPMGFTRYNTNGFIEPYEPPANPFKVPDREIELVAPVVPNLPEVTFRGTVEYPGEVDLSGRPDLSAYGPQMPEPRDWSEWTYVPRSGPPTTPFDRRAR